MFTDTLFAKTKSNCQNTCAPVFCTGNGFVRAYPMQSKQDAHFALSKFFKEEGVLNTILLDNAAEEKSKDFSRKCHEADCYVCYTEPRSP